LDDFGSFLVDSSLPLSDDASTPDLLPYSSGGPLGSFPFTDGAFDASISGSLNFGFDDLMDDSAFAVDAQTSGAA
jgi:hypothetical protein